MPVAREPRESEKTILGIMWKVRFVYNDGLFFEDAIVKI